MKGLTLSRPGTSGRGARSKVSTKAVGLDVGATAARATSVHVTTTDGVPAVTLDRAADVPLPPGTVVNGSVENPAALTDALRLMWREADLGTDQVVLGVANPQVVVRDLTVPDMDPGQRAKALPFLAKDVIALPIDVAILDFVPLGPPDPETRQVSGLLVGTPREPVLAMVRAVERAGLHVARVDLASFGVLRAAAREDLEVEAVVDLGAHLTTIVIHRGGVPRLVRTVARGGQELTERLADRLGCTPEEAEVVKRGHGLAGSHIEAVAALQEAVRPLLSEVRSSLNYFRSGNAGAGVERLALTGGGAALPGLADTLSQQVRVPAVVVGPAQPDVDWWEQVAGSQAKPRPTPAATSLSVGLAIGAAA